jgi:hypothetical protein
MEKIEFGFKCRDIITGFEGVIVERATFITGCDRVKMVRGSEEKDTKWFDVPTLEFIDDEVCKKLQNTGCSKYDDLLEAKYDFGVTLEDKITKYKGAVIGKALSITGDINYGLSPTFDRSSKENDAKWHDESRLTVIIETPKSEINTTSKRSGGVTCDLKIR